ncbi:MAG: hypothetical protein LW855_04765 [Alphaproteobacteria bacterium]|jgi:hypothetical protein|nr:hypothetical protein [Alphaproteobacteria bacterium]
MNNSAPMQRLKRKNRAVLVLLVAMVGLIFAVSIVQIQRGFDTAAAQKKGDNPAAVR